jgi:prepilin-type N-terminal cleavage/methylation domain-containing protein
MNAQRHHGFTLLEMAIAIAVLGIVAAVAVPSYSQLLARQQLRSAGSKLALDLRMAREQALQSGRPVFFSSQAGADWCWGLGAGQACDCAGGVPACTIGRSGASDYPRVELARADALEFEPAMGRAQSAGSIELKTLRKQQLQVQVNAMGRAHLCGPDAPRPGAC